MGCWWVFSRTYMICLCCVSSCLVVEKTKEKSNYMTLSAFGRLQSFHPTWVEIWLKAWFNDSIWITEKKYFILFGCWEKIKDKIGLWIRYWLRFPFARNEAQYRVWLALKLIQWWSIRAAISKIYIKLKSFPLQWLSSCYQKMLVP